MQKSIFQFVQRHRVCVLAVEMPNGMPHAAALHYSEQQEPVKLFFSTTRSSKKFKAFNGGRAVKASVVIGFSEEEWLTMQMDGEARIVEKNQLAEVHKIHYKKHPDAEQYKDSPNTIFLEFTPTLWRYTDFNTDPETIISSGENSGQVSE